MAFKASKVRQRRVFPVGRGTAVAPNAGVREWYEKRMWALTKSMIDDYRATLRAAVEHPDVEPFYATDDTASEKMSNTMKRLKAKWSRIFGAFAEETAKTFAEKCEKSATASTLHSLSVAGVKWPTATYNEAVKNTMGAAVEFNHTLITNISEEVHEKIYNAVMLSLTSPVPEQQGTSGIENALKEVGGFSKKRIELIARDQTAKLTSSLSDERMEENGVEEYEWAHSSAGKTPRESHKAMNGHVFKLDDPRVWKEGGEFNLKKGDLGPPGWAINCRCRRIPLIGYAGER